jgi:hypothetical protein
VDVIDTLISMTDPHDERFKIEGDPEDALRGLLAVDPESIDPEAKDAALKRLQNAPIEEMDVFGHALREDALQAGATEQEIRDAEALPPLPSS